MAEVENVQVKLTKTGTTTLATAGKYCNRNIDINADEVYAAGKQAEYDQFWDTIQYNATYLPAFFAGRAWRDSTFKPKYDIKPKGSCEYMFRYSLITDLKGILEKQGVVLDTSLSTNMNNFGAYNQLTRVPTLNLTGVTNKTSYMFTTNDGSSKLTYIEEIIVSETTQFQQTSFQYCDKLEHVIFTGPLSTKGLDLRWSPLLDRESLVSIIKCLSKTATASGLTVTLSETAVNNAFTTEEWAAIAGTESAVGEGIIVDGELIVRPANWSIALL